MIAQNVASVVGDLAGIFPFVYVILALPPGRWLDARFGRALGLGAVLTAAAVLSGGPGQSVSRGALLPDIVARRNQRRGMLEIAVAVGFFLLADLPVVLDWSELHAGPERAGGAADSCCCPATSAVWSWC